MTDEQRDAEILRLHDAGKTRNQIARELQLGRGTVDRVCEAAGRSFDRAQSTFAIRAAAVDLEESRMLLAQKMMLAAHDVLDTLDGPYLVYNFGGRDNTYTEHLLDSVPIDVRLDAMRTAGVAFEKATRIVERGTNGLDGALGVLDTLAAGFQAAAAELRGQETDSVQVE